MEIVAYMYEDHIVAFLHMHGYPPTYLLIVCFLHGPFWRMAHLLWQILY